MIRPLIAGLLALLSLRPVAAVPLANLVSDETALVLVIEDAPTLVKNWDRSPWARTWQDEQMKKFLAPMRAELKVDEWDEQMKAETGYTVRELLAFAKGGVLIALPDFQFALDDEKKAVPPLLFAVELGENTVAVEKLLAAESAKEAKFTEDREEFAGVTVHIRRDADAAEGEAPFVWAMADGVWLVSSVKEKVFAAIDALKKGGIENSLGKSERFLRLKQRQADAHMIGIVNFQSIYPVIKGVVAKQKANGEQEPNAMGLDPEAVLSALGLDVFQEMFFTARISEDATEVHGGVTYLEERGLVKLLAYREGPAARPAFVPAKWASVSSSNFSMRDGYAALEEMLLALSPQLSGMVQAQIKGFGQRVGIDIKRDLIGSLGHEVISAYALRTGLDPAAPPSLEDMDQFFAISLDNAAGFTRAFDALKRMAGPAADQLFTKRDYLGHTLYSFVAPAVEGQPAAQGFSYAITDRYLFLSVGTPGPVESALQGAAGAQPSFWDQATVKAALADVPANASAIQYQDVRLLMTMAIETVAKFAPLATGAGPGEVQEGDPAENADAPKPAPRPQMVDVEAKPDGETLGKYWADALGYVYREGNGIYGVSKLNHPK